MGAQRAHAGGHLVLILGRHRQLCTATEIPPSEAVPMLRAYLRKWKFETGMFFEGMTPDSTDAEWAEAASPVTPSSPSARPRRGIMTAMANPEERLAGLPRPTRSSPSAT